jgi:hypothetical protein
MNCLPNLEALLPEIIGVKPAYVELAEAQDGGFTVTYWNKDQELNTVHVHVLELIELIAEKLNRRENSL